MPNKAKIYSYTVIHVGSVEFHDKVPYLIAVAENDQNRFLTKVEGYSEGQDIQIGMEVEFLRYDEKGKSIYILATE